MVFDKSAACPLAVLLSPVLFLRSALAPVAVLRRPFVVSDSAYAPLAVLYRPVVLFPSELYRPPCRQTCGVAPKRILTLSRVAIGIASVRRRAYRRSVWRKRKAHNQE